MKLLHVENKATFTKEILTCAQPALVDFWAPWCGPCTMLGPVIEEIAQEEQEAVVAKVNVDEANDLAAEYGVMSIPTIIYFKDGKEVKRLVGVQPKAELVKNLKALK
ncbi:MAG: thioredoxin [Acidaminococcaceae bacterium]